jgi:hypothetical protein
MNTKAKVPSTQTGDSPSDGGTSGIRMPAALGHNVLTNTGRHAKGSLIAQPGTIRGGQSEDAGNKPITGVPPGAPIRSMNPIPSIPANQAETSKDAEARILAPPQPFTYNTLSAALAAPRVGWNPDGAVPYDVHTDPNKGPQVIGGGHAPMSDAEIAAAASVDGMPSSKGVNPINSGFPTRGNQRQAGTPGSRNSNTSSRENSRMRQG